MNLKRFGIAGVAGALLLSPMEVEAQVQHPQTLEQRIAAGQNELQREPYRALFDRLHRELNQLERERDSEYESKEELYRSLVWLVNDDLTELAGRFGIRLNYQGTMAYGFTDSVVLHYVTNNGNIGDITYNKDGTAMMHWTSLIWYRVTANFRRLNLTEEETKDLDSFHKDPQFLDYVSTLSSGYDFDSIYREVRKLQRERLNNLGRDSNLGLSPKYFYISNKLHWIEDYFSKRYRLWDGHVSAGGNRILVSVNSSVKYNLVIWRNRPATLRMLDREENTISFEKIYPVK